MSEENTESVSRSAEIAAVINQVENEAAEVAPDTPAVEPEAGKEGEPDGVARRQLGSRGKQAGVQLSETFGKDRVGLGVEAIDGDQGPGGESLGPSGRKSEVQPHGRGIGVLANRRPPQTLRAPGRRRIEHDRPRSGSTSRRHEIAVHPVAQLGDHDLGESRGGKL